MEGLFTLSADQLKLIQEQLPQAWAKLDEKTRDYLQTIIDCNDQAEGLGDTLNETLTQVTFDSLYSSFSDMLMDMESSTEDFANDFEQYMQKAIINSMMNEKYKDRLKNWYQSFTDSNVEGVTTSEYQKLREEWNQNVNDAIAERDSLKDMFSWSSDDDSTSDNS